MPSEIEPTWLVPAEPSFVRSTARSTVSPGTRFDAPTASRFTEPRAIETVPEVNACVSAAVELVNVAYVPRPAMLAAAAMTAIEASSLGSGAERFMDVLLSRIGRRRLLSPGPLSAVHNPGRMP